MKGEIEAMRDSSVGTVTMAVGQQPGFCTVTEFLSTVIQGCRSPLDLIFSRLRYEKSKERSSHETLIDPSDMRGIWGWGEEE
jgi:hypothetical protein